MAPFNLLQAAQEKKEKITLAVDDDGDGHIGKPSVECISIQA